MTNFEVYEDNGGNLYMVILRNDTPIRIFCGFEMRGELREGIAQLKANPTAYESWDGDYVDACNGGAGWAETEDEYLTACLRLYDMVSRNDLIATNDWLEDIERMGAAARYALDIEEVD